MAIKNFLFLSILVSWLISCSSGENVKIGLLLPNKIDDRFSKDQFYFTQRIKDLGGEVLCMEAQNNDQLQISQANELIDKGVKALVVCAVNRYTAPIIVRNAHVKGIKVIAYERIISNCSLDFYVAFDNIKVGELMASYAINSKPTGKYMLFGGDKSDQNAVWVHQGMHKIIDSFIQNGKIKVLYDVYTEEWSGENAYFELRRFLRLSNERPDVILSAYDGISIGIIKALNESKISSWPLITGQNAEIMTCKSIVKGEQAMTIYKPFKKEAEQAAELAIECANGKNVKLSTSLYNESIQVPSILIEPITVDESDIKTTIIADGFLKESDIYDK